MQKSYMHQNYLKGMNDHLKVSYLKEKAEHFSNKVLHSIGVTHKQRLRTKTVAWENECRSHWNYKKFALVTTGTATKPDLHR